MTIKQEKIVRYFLCAMFSLFTVICLSLFLAEINRITKSGILGYAVATCVTAVITLMVSPSAEKCALRLIVLILIPYGGIVINVFSALKRKEKRLQNSEKVRLWVDKRQFIKESKENFECFFTGEKYFADLISELKNAKQEVLIFSYIFTFGKASTILLNEIFSLLNRGVKVTIGVDYFGSGDVRKNETVQSLKKEGLKVIVKNKPFLFLLANDNRRVHAKTVIIDKKIVYLSSSNIDDKSIFEDINYSVKIKGEVSEIYNEYAWLFNLPKVFEKKTDSFFPLLSKGNIQNDGLYVDFILKAQRDIKIVTPYLSFNGELEKAIKRRLLSGVKMTVILPSPRYPSKIDPVSEYYSRVLCSLGVKVLYESGNFLHSKMIIIDDFFAVLGSNNFDMRSGYATETMLLTIDNGLIAPLLRNFNYLKDNAYPINEKTRTGKFLGKLYSVIAPLV